MTVEIKAPQFPESVSEGTLVTWHYREGDAVTQDSLVAEIETDKIILEVNAPESGILAKILVPEGATLAGGTVIAQLEAGEVTTAAPSGQVAAAPVADAPAPAREAVANPAARRLAEEKGVDLSALTGTGKDGRITKEDVLAAANAPASAPAKVRPDKQPVPSAQATPEFHEAMGDREEKRVPMTRLRARIAERLMQAKNETAMLTTFNEINMAPIMSLRQQHKDAFEKRHGVKLGFMSFFVKAATEALKRFPAVNASIDGNDIVYHGYQDIGVAVSSDRGLVVPILRNCEFMSLADVEQSIVDYGEKARAGKIAIEDITGGTFTISNGGIFGSLLSTPILNPPQTAILGMHKIQERPMAVKGEVVIQPMMYLALSYDHRLIDGKEAVQFLVTIKEQLEDPARMLLDI
jgi:2-oxoglutarate dehydrogenase E2 component (dihydrolipoamide succinyltransferase)